MRAIPKSQRVTAAPTQADLGNQRGLIGWSNRALTGATWMALTILTVFVQTALLATPEQIDFFEQRIRPMLVNECYECHGANKQKGGLRVDFRDGLLEGGDTGPAVIPGHAEKSLLIQSIRHVAPDSKMPKDRGYFEELHVYFDEIRETCFEIFRENNI